MKNNNKLTLQKLQQELEALKANKKGNKGSSKQSDTHNKSDVAGHDIKNSYINNLYMKSSMFYLWLITGIIGYGSKVPIIRKIIGLLSLWYGKTTIWKLLIKLRKMFVVFNALIGMVVVFKTTGFGIDTFWAHFSAMGVEYAIIFKNFVSRLFDWLLNLFDHKIVPNIPTNKPTNPSSYGWWTPRGIDYSWYNKLPRYDNPQALEWVKNPFQINYSQNTPWYKDWSTILWIGGFIGLVGLGYYGYKLYYDPLWSTGGAIPPVNVDDDDLEDVAGGSSIAQSIIYSATAVSRRLVTVYTGVRNTLNPFSWFNYASELERQSEQFIARQSSISNAMDNNLYPFTEIHPFRPWYHRIRILTLGETVLEHQERINLRDYILRDVAAITLEDTRSLGSMTPASAVGVGVKPVEMGFTGMLEAAQTWSKIKSLPTTPNIIPGSQLPEISGGNENWAFHQIDNSEDYIAESKTIKGKTPVTASPIPTVETTTSLPAVETTTIVENSPSTPVVEPTTTTTVNESSSGSSSGRSTPASQNVSENNSTPGDNPGVDPLFPI